MPKLYLSLIFFPRSQVVLGNASVPATSLPQPGRKQSFADKCVPKYNLGTRENESINATGFVLAGRGYFESLIVRGPDFRFDRLGIDIGINAPPS
jgi:hypothetical protein